MISILRAILEDKAQRTELIKQFQNEIWDRNGEGPYFEILSTLAIDLDYYEPDEQMRREDPSFYGDDRLEQEIIQALKALEGLEGSVPTS
ncbi:MAG: hypothetical protein J0I17_08505 ['Candidatus Kapabacteria' thiocyanatum]|uniref:Colicin D immunity protein domain-containing protein n=1 Tax=Candidatus Kapaibacterium thiocyanatum TaxID=1895771 RepID=A0A1M3KZC6_9BACT|nr:hypothetical protein ['Candidatus Kapabacteria' thiocyanatum]OJX57847.1 MAG: hypothetical protein BGO89_07715 ['Candidatus Kapabacteria' thiocyanatum]